MSLVSKQPIDAGVYGNIMCPYGGAMDDRLQTTPSCFDTVIPLPASSLRMLRRQPSL